MGRFEVMLLAKQLREAYWEPGVGDPTVLGWVTVGCYTLAAVLCLVCFLRRARLIEVPCVRRFGLFWLGLALCMALLAVNKQLDLQGLAHVTGRNLAIRQGWFDRRHEAMRGALVALGVAGVLSVGGLLLVMRGLWTRVRLAVAGVAMLVGFAVVRVAELWELNRFTKVRLVGPIDLSHAIELAGVAMVMAGALVCSARSKSAVEPASHTPA